ncbi:MAG: DUF6177 family protein [Micrococcales bacterium]|nr:DUF6177 family protein [Micrococcales bacterium]
MDTLVEADRAEPAQDCPVGWHPAVDDFDERYVVFATPSLTVRFTEPFASFVGEAAVRQVRPVLVTRTDARVSPFVSSVMARAGGVWAVQARDCATYDAFTGSQVGSPVELWERPDTDGDDVHRDRLAGFADPSGSAVQVVTFDVRTHQIVGSSTKVGMVAEQVGALLGTSWQCWSTREPLLAGWDIDAVTTVVRRGMPDSPTVRAGGTDGAFCEVQASRTGAGVSEHTLGGVPVSADADLAALATKVGELVVGQHNLTFASVAVADYDHDAAGLVHSPRARVPEVPVAVVLGPTMVRDLGVDVAKMVDLYGARVVGRAQVPSLLVVFGEGDPVRRLDKVVQFYLDAGVGDALTGTRGAR